LFPANLGDIAVKNVGAAKNANEFMAKGAFWIDDRPYENYKQLRQYGYGRPNGRVRIFIDEFTRVGHDALPNWHERWQATDDSYKFSMLVTRAPWYMQADPNFINNPILKHVTTRNFMDCVWLSPRAGEKLGLQEGEEVILESNPKYMKDLPRPLKAKLHLSTRITRDDCVLLYHGTGHRAKNLTVARNYGYRDGDLVPQKDPSISKVYDPLGMGWVEDVFVSIRKA
jgi:anaerobic selenocysteine-containing dehydrogenase